MASKVQKSLYLATPLAFTPSPTEGFLSDDLRKIFRECQRIGKVPIGVENCRKFQAAK